MSSPLRNTEATLIKLVRGGQIADCITAGKDVYRRWTREILAFTSWGCHLKIFVVIREPVTILGRSPYVVLANEVNEVGGWHSKILVVARSVFAEKEIELFAREEAL
ncbi:hypothetical protein CDAR_320951 [Caerostris darwini]|uniref:Uncharacterized protein n=1 Tax=Caerostris darwini TaxID=1538125 RepID=A0AAV4X0D5_9ARAC|nr:hypothetical protein CDAR_320951 [Caerostris darwini]